MGPKLIWGANVGQAYPRDIENTPGGQRQGETGHVWRWVKNSSASLIVKGQSVCFDGVAKSGTDVHANVTAAVTANLMLYAGVATCDIPAGYWGFVLCYGDCDYALVLGPAISGGTAATVGRYYKPTNGQTYLIDDGATPVAPRTAVMMEAIATVTTPVVGTKKVYVRAL